MKKILLLSIPLVLIATTQVRADETSIHLKPAAGLDTVEGNCGACHSLDYIPMNSPIQDEKGWTATVGKMVKALGAPIPEDDQKTIIAYLSSNYTKE